MISGALLLKNRDEPLEVIFKKRIFYKVTTLMLASIITSIKGILWFLYAYIAFLLILPFLRNLVNNLDKKYFYYIFFGALFFMGILPSLQHLLSIEIEPGMSYFDKTFFTSRIIVYPLLGYFIHYHLDMKKIKEILPVMWLFNFLFILLAAYITYFQWKMTGVFIDDKPRFFHSAFDVINAVCMFMTIKYICSIIKFSNNSKKVISSLAKSVFGIFLIHNFVLNIPSFHMFLKFLHSIGINSMLSAFIASAIVFLVCYVIITVCLKIPYLNKLIS